MEIIPLQSFCYVHAPIVSCPAWGNGMHTDRKLLAKGFLLGAGERNTLSFLTGGTKTLSAFLPAPPVILTPGEESRDMP